MRIFYECRLTEQGPGYPIDLLGIGMVREDGAEYQAVTYGPEAKPRRQIADEVAEFIFAQPYPQMWSCCGAFDYVALRQLFGKAGDAPDGFPSFSYELMQEIELAGFPVTDLPPRGSGVTTAIGAARWVRTVALFLDDLPVVGGAVRE